MYYVCTCVYIVYTRSERTALSILEIYVFLLFVFFYSSERNIVSAIVLGALQRTLQSNRKRSYANRKSVT